MAGRPVVFDFIARDRNYTGGLQKMERHSVRFGATLGRVSGVAVRAFGGIGVAAVGLGVAGATMGIKTAAGLEQAQVAFTTLLGSGRKAQTFLADLKKFAAATPFELPGLIDSARLLLGVGVEAKQVVPLLRDFGDAAGAVGVGQEAFQRIMLATSQAISAGRFATEDLNQITENGIPIWRILAEATGKPVPKLRELASSGKLLAKDVLPLLERQMRKDYGGSMARQSQTLSGLWSTFMDTINIGLADTIKPFEGELKGGLKGAIAVAGTALAGVTKFLADPKTGLVPKIREFIDTHGPQFKAILDTVKRAFDTIHNALADPEKGVVPNLDKLRQSWDDNKEAIIGFQNAIPGANTLLHAMGTLVHRIIEEVTGLGKLLLGLGALASVGAQAVRVAFDAIGIAALKVQGFFQTLVIHFLESLRTLAGVVDRLLGTHLAGTLDGALKQMRTARADTQAQVDKLKTDATTRFRELQREINKLHGKTIDIKARTNVEITKSVRQYLAASGVPGFHQKGTLIPGYGGGDIYPAMLEPGEAVVPKDKARRSDFRAWAASMGIPGFQAGGLATRYYNPTVSETRRIGQSMADVADYVIRHFGGSPAIKAFIRSVDPLPYIWGAAGPGGYDCSGLVSAVLGKMTGRGGGHGQRYFTTSSIHSGILGISSGLGGVLQIGVTPGRGHMAGRYGGVGFEAESTRTGIKTGSAASRPESFARHYHLAKGGLVGPSMRWLDAQHLAIGGDPAKLRVERFDRGGMLLPGHLGYNGTGRGEPVGLDEDRLAAKIAAALVRALREQPPRVQVDDIHTGLIRKKNGRMGGMSLGLS